ncbi:DUF4142 domain-containing protein [Pedobacter hiemivivus]|uniref:DUF4142 domain-containing protein n=1 Tax=Pedobacter hiemivivus TaxID=2530454 RepID=A0A4V5PC81_9SPHI|nr:DUF4142 domain-containing protein [Pedobacter hiemivivus]TKC59206.1 DUF4142 domain-containing protein [Pedobacter hiemivivus]
MKIYWKNLVPVCALIVLQACSNPDRNGRDAAASQITDTISDTTRRAQTVTADVDLNGDGKVFALSAATGGMMEVEAAGIAVNRSKDPSVKAFATRLLNDHSKANEELKRIVEEKGLQVAQRLPATLAGHLAKLNTLSDRAFDVQYLQMMINDHHNALQLFTDGSRLADTQLKAFAVKTLPLIEQHYQKALEIGKRLNITNANNGDDVLGTSPAKVEKK